MKLDKRINYLYKSCFHKKCYTTLEFAKEKAIQFKEMFNKDYYIYLCPVCLNYHLTTHKRKGVKYLNETN